MMGDFTSAITNIQGKYCFIPKFMFTVDVRKVWIVVPFAASSILLTKEVF